jgi:putative Mg2+ transporter-C (MgtC) family protein
MTTEALAVGDGQHVKQVSELLIAFGLSTLIGLERQLRGKSAGLRTQAIVGTTAALIMLISKYGFDDVLTPGRVVLDPSRVVAQVVSGVGFLGAGLILTRQGTVRGLTTAAAVWETAAIGMAAGAGLPILALIVTGLHFVVSVGHTTLIHHLPTRGPIAVRGSVHYVDGRGVLRAVLAEVTHAGWSVYHLGQEEVAEERAGAGPPVRVLLGLSGTGALDELLSAIGRVDGVTAIQLDVATEAE